jgi:phosphoribosylaminoimidazole-succinocarboxamide synthase
MKTALKKTQLNLPGQKSVYYGKVRDVYTLANNLLVMVATDRISAFDVILEEPIPFKGQVLNQLANFFLDQTQNLVPNWKLSSPDPAVTIGRKAEPFKVEMVIRGYLTGHAWRLYKSGQRHICGIALPDGMRENQRFSEPIITPTTKAQQGAHDEDISREEILKQNLVREDDYLVLEDYTRKLFAAGQAHAQSRGLILVDTKYEFGQTTEGEIILIDEIHTPDSSRYFYAEAYAELFAKNQAQEQLSKEFVRQWLIKNNFQGKPGQQIPSLPKPFVKEVSQRYQNLFKQITGKDFVPAQEKNPQERIQTNINLALPTL